MYNDAHCVGRPPGHPPARLSVYKNTITVGNFFILVQVVTKVIIVIVHSMCTTVVTTRK